MLKFTPEGIYCEPGNFYIDPWLPVEKAVITHAHSDHARSGMRSYLAHYLTVPALKSRLGNDIQVQEVAYNEPLLINGVKVSLHPAGHIIGSAQVRMEYKGKIIVASGDYKLQYDGLSTPFEPVQCHEFITESTFGLPIYNWLSVAEQNKQLQEWINNNLQAGKTPVLAGYTLGKAQRIMKATEGLGQLFVHPAIARINKALETAGIDLPAYTPIDLQQSSRQLEKGIVIVPPSLTDTQLIKKIPRSAVAICSGWMQVRGARRWRSADAGFAISDHADWPGLLQAIKDTRAEKVYVTHGQTAVFAKYLNETGIAAAAEIKTAFGTQEDEPVTETYTPSTPDSL